MCSFGKDATATMALLEEFGIDYTPVYLYYVRGLSWTETLVRHYEARFGRSFLQLPHWEILNRRINLGLDSGPKWSYSEHEQMIRRITGRRWVVYGYRKTDSMERRAMLTNAEINFDTRRIYPIADWTPKHVFGFCKSRRMPLPRSYQDDFRNLDTIKTEVALYVYNNYPDDWKKVEEQLPWAKAILLHAIKNI